MTGVIEIIKVWADQESCKCIGSFEEFPPPPQKKMVRVGIIYDGAYMYDIRSKLENPVTFGGQPLVFLHGPMVRVPGNGPHVRLSSIRGFRAESRKHLSK